MWVHEQGLRTNQGSSTAKTLMTHRLHDHHRNSRVHQTPLSFSLPCFSNEAGSKRLVFGSYRTDFIQIMMPIPLIICPRSGIGG